MSEMVEKVARKLVQELSEIPADDGLLDRLPDEDRDAALRISFALIVAMREPTEAMIVALAMANSSAEQPNKYAFDLDVHARAEWHAAIDEALK